MTGADSASATPGCPLPSGTCWGRSSMSLSATLFLPSPLSPEGRGEKNRSPSYLRRAQVGVVVGVLDRRQVRRPRPRVQVLQQAVVARARVRLCHAALRIVEVAEDDGPGGTHGLAGGQYLAIAHPLVASLLGLDAGGVDALHAV